MLFISIAMANGNANILQNIVPSLHAKLKERSKTESGHENEREGVATKHDNNNSNDVHPYEVSHEVKSEESDLTQEEEDGTISMPALSEAKGGRPPSRRYQFCENSFVLQEEATVREHLRKIFTDYCLRAPDGVMYMSPIRYSSIYRCCTEESGDLYSEMKMYKM